MIKIKFFILRGVDLMFENSISTHFERFDFWPLLSNFRKIENGLEKKLLDQSGLNFLCDVCWPIGKPRKKCLLLVQRFKKLGHPNRDLARLEKCDICSRLTTSLSLFLNRFIFIWQLVLFVSPEWCSRPIIQKINFHDCDNIKIKMAPHVSLI